MIKRVITKLIKIIKTTDEFQSLLLRLLITNINDIASRLNLGEQVDVLSLDFSKAFDRVPDERLFCKLDYYGICGTYLQ